MDGFLRETAFPSFAATTLAPQTQFLENNVICFCPGALPASRSGRNADDNNWHRPSAIETWTKAGIRVGSQECLSRCISHESCRGSLHQLVVRPASTIPSYESCESTLRSRYSQSAHSRNWRNALLAAFSWIACRAARHLHSAGSPALQSRHPRRRIRYVFLCVFIRLY